MSKLLARLRDERGFTLIEVLIATIAGLLVAGAALAILATSYQMLANNADRVDANQQGRTAMLEIEQLLNSSCVAGLGVSPIVGGSSAGSGAPPSGANSITFLSSQSDLPTTLPYEEVVSLSGSGALQLQTYTNPSGSEPDWIFPTTATTTATLVSHAGLVPGSSAIFQYYPYNSDGTVSSSADQLVGNYLPTSSAETVAGVKIQFEAAPTDGVTRAGGNVDFSDQVNLSLTPASSTGSSSGTPEPCT